MPYVNIKLAMGEEVTREQKEELIAATTNVISNILNKNPKATYVVIDEVHPDNWGVGGESLTTIRKAER
jgi:4-oxalocrotonate tautomerase